MSTEPNECEVFEAQWDRSRECVDTCVDRLADGLRKGASIQDAYTTVYLTYQGFSHSTLGQMVALLLTNLAVQRVEAEDE